MATGQGDEIVATEAMKHGALDYLPKSSIDVLSIRRITEGAVEKAALLKKVADQREELANFASVLVHDLKAPIRSVILLSSMMKRDIEEGGNPGQVVEMCGVVNESARRMGELIEALFEYTKAEHRASFEPVAMERVVGDSLINLAATIQERGARITHDELPTVSGNSPQLIQLMQNLVGNSIKYCDKTPAIHVQARIHQEGVWLFSVRDNGIGIAEKYYRRIFEPFKRVCDTNKYEGSGLGLATCKKIVERHKGGIWCESREDYGTTFFFTLHGAASS